MKSKKIMCALLVASIISTTTMAPKATTFINESSTKENSQKENVKVYNPHLSYKLNRTFNGSSDKENISEDIDAVKSLSEGAIVSRFKTSEKSKEQVIFSMTDYKDSASHLVVKLLADGRIRYEVKENGAQKIGFSFGNNLNDGKEHTVIINCGERGLELYIDGERAYYTTAYRNFFTEVNTPDSMNIGTIVNSSNASGQEFFQGEIDYVDIYNKELSIEEGERISNELILNYDINKSFNGTSDSIDISEDINKVKDLTKGAIVSNFKTTSTAANQMIFSMTDSNDPSSNLYIGLQNGKLRYEVREGGTLKAAFTYQNLILNDGNEHKVLLSCGDRGLELYIDGIMLVNYTDYKNFFKDINTPNSMNIGKIVNSTSPNGTWYYNGDINNVGVYGREVTSDEAKELTNISNEGDVEQKPEDYNRLIELIQSEEEVNMVFAGDSITHGVQHTKGYRSYSEHFNERIRGEEVNGRVKKENFIINTGVSSATTTDILNNFDKVIGTNNPKVVFVMIGMNDCTTMSLAQYETNLKEIVRKIREIGALPVLQTCNTANSREVVANYMAKMRDVAKAEAVVLIDHYKYWEDKERENPGTKNSWLNDSIHPNEKGHLEMSKLIFRELQLDTDDSYTNNLTYPLTTKGAYVDTSSVYPYPEYNGIEGEKSLVSYKVDKEFYQSDYIDKSTDVDKIKDLSSGTIVARFNLTSGGNAQTLISLSDSNDPSSNATLAINGGKLYFESRENGSYSVNATSSKGGYNDGKWHTAVLVSDAEGTKVYVDGEKVISDSRKGFFNIVQTPNSLNIGRNTHEGGKGEWFYNGAISYVDIYEASLTEENAIKVSRENGTKDSTIPNKDGVLNIINENQDGHWVFLGDGSTSSKGDTYGYKNFVEYIEERVRWEMNGGSMIKRRKFMVNSGVDGATSTEILANFDKWAKSYNPKLVSVMIGGKENATPEVFEENLRNIISKIKEIGAVPMLQTPTIQEGNISAYIEVIRKIAAEEGIALIDHYEYWSTIAVNQPQVRESWLNENYEPNHRGHLEIAKKVISDLGISGSGVIGSFSIPYTETTVGTLKEELQTLVNTAKELYNNSIEGSKPGEYKEGSKEALKLAIDLGERELSRENSTMAIVNSRVKELKESIKIFNESINPEDNYEVYENGDFNQNGSIEIGDLAIASRHYGKNIESPDWKEVRKYDINKDGKIDDFEVDFIVNIIK